jgi:tetratricopeptide (TPR) repeat protein
MAKKLYILLCMFNFVVLPKALPQNYNLDSLRSILKNQGNDTNKVNTLNLLGWELKFNSPDTSIILGKQAVGLATKLKWKAGQANAYGQMGVYFAIKSLYDTSIQFFEKAIKIDRATGDKKGMSAHFGNIANVCRIQGNYPKSLQYYFKALKIEEALKNRSGMASSYGNIGTIYREQGENKKALTFLLRSMKIKEELGLEFESAATIINIGSVYSALNDTAMALRYFYNGLKIAEKHNNKDWQAKTHANIGNLFFRKKEYTKAEKHYLNAITHSKELGSKGLIASRECDMAWLYVRTGKFAEAEKMLQASLKTSTELGMVEQMQSAHSALAHLYDTTGRSKLAFEHYKQFIVLRDSITNNQNTKRQTQLEMQYEFDKQQAADSIRTAEHSKQEKEKHARAIQVQKMYTYGGIIGFGLMVVVAFVSFRAFKNKQKANKIIAHQKELVEEKQKEIIDSIRYAKRIQLALLPNEKYIERHLKRK